MPPPQYVLITAARNEAQFIELTIMSVVAQAVRPLKWVIVSDGSTDGTDDIVSKYAAEHSWIELIRMPERRERHFAGKARAFNVGYAKVAGLGYDVIGNLDADVSFDHGYIGNLLRKFSDNPRLGICGTPYLERAVQGASRATSHNDGLNDNDWAPVYDYRFASLEDVPGACQLFRRRCFEEIGGYAPVKGGNLDSIAVMSARMKGWETKTFIDETYRHHRASGSAQCGMLKSRFKRGVKAYAVGNHPIWEVLRAGYLMTKRPFVIGGLAGLSGYVWSLIRRPERPIPSELVVFHRREQMQRLRKLFTGNWLVSRGGL